MTTCPFLHDRVESWDVGDVVYIVQRGWGCVGFFLYEPTTDSNYPGEIRDDTTPAFTGRRLDNEYPSRRDLTCWNPSAFHYHPQEKVL
jgi:hypothetical protein